MEWFLPRAKQIKRILNPRGSFFLNIKPGSNNGERSLYVFDLVLALKRELDFKFIDEFSWVKMPYMGSYPNKLKNSFEPIYHFSVDNPNDIIFNPLACGTPLKDSSLKRAFRKESKTPDSGSKMLIHNRLKTSEIKLVRPSNVLQINNVVNQSSKRKLHPASFPKKLVEFFVKTFSNENSLVLDPFAGSGTVGEVCIELDRNFILIEKKREYYDLILENCR